MALQLITSQKSFGGWHQQFSHNASTLSCQMRFAVYLPPQAKSKKVPVLYWLSGLTCTDENFMQKAGALKIAAALGIAIIAPDTSPRGKTVPDASDQYDLGQGAGFYVNATQSPWSTHYQMYDYITEELPTLIESKMAISSHRSISGHSMGGHGALVIGLRNPERYQSISAFSPICNPVNSPWGRKAFTAYLGDDQQTWQQYDASLLMTQNKSKLPIKVDIGDADQFLNQQLKPETLMDAATGNNLLNIHLQPSYDHSYYFIASFIEEHFHFHSKYLL